MNRCHSMMYREWRCRFPSRFSSLAVSALALALLSPDVRGAATYTTEDNGATLVVTVDADGATLDASQVTSSITNIAKRGPGKLTSVAISSYTGDFDIEEGIWCCTDAKHFGATSTTASSGTIHVRNGASIEYAGSNKYSGAISGKTVHLYGTAASGATQGAKIFLTSNIQMADPGLGKNMTIILHDDASIYSQNRLTLIGTFDLDGHALTLKNATHDIGGVVTNGGSVVISSSTTWMTQSAAINFAADCAATAFVQVNGTFNIKDKRTYAHGWTIKNNGGTITCNTVRFPTRTDTGIWEGPIEFSSAAKIANYGATSGAWNVTNTVFNAMGSLSGTGTLAVGPGWLNLHGVWDNTYSGAVTVQGKSKNMVPNGQNAQPVLAGSGGIGVWNGAAVFTNAASITLKDSARVEFMDDVAATVGALRFVGDTSTFTGDPGDDTQSIKGGIAAASSTVAGLTKTGSNTLVIDTPAHFTSPATISGGTLKIPYRSEKGTPGLLETHITPVSPGSPNWDDGYVWAGSSWNGTNNRWPISRPWLANYQQHLNYEEKGVCAIGPQRGVRPMINNGNGGNPHWSDGYTGGRNGWWYRGYIWNNSDEPLTYTFWSGLMDHAAVIYFGADHDMLFFPTDTSSELYAAHSVKPAAAKAYILQPGATPIDVFVWANGGPSTKWSYGIPSNGERYGIVFAPSSVCTSETLNAQIVAFYNEASVSNTNAVRDTLRQFSEFKDTSGVGELFTTDVYGSGDEDKITAQQPVFDDLAFAYGTTLDLSDNLAFQVKNLSGSPAVENVGIFGVTNCWTLLAADFPKDNDSVRHPMTVDGALAFPAGATFDFDDRTAVTKKDTIVATTTDGITGVPAPAAGLKGWRLKIVGDDLVLTYSLGTVLFFR